MLDINVVGYISWITPLLISTSGVASRCYGRDCISAIKISRFVEILEFGVCDDGCLMTGGCWRERVFGS